MESYLQQLSESREHLGDGLVVSLGDTAGRADVFWSNPGACWVILDWRGESPKVTRLPEIALVQCNRDVDVSLHDLQDAAFAFDSLDADACVYVLPVTRLNALAGYTSEFTVQWRSDRP